MRYTMWKYSAVKEWLCVPNLLLTKSTIFWFSDVPKDGFESEDTDVDGSEEGDIQDEQFSDNEDNFIDDCKLVY